MPASLIESNALDLSLSGIHATPVENNLHIWNALIDGPADTCFEDGLFTLTMEFGENYPLTPPTVRFTCKMFHPNGL